MLVSDREEVRYGTVLAGIRPAPIRCVEQAGMVPVRQVIRSEQEGAVSAALGKTTIDQCVVAVPGQPGAWITQLSC